MYKIGEFSKIVDIPVRTLRFYDQYGVIQPSEIDNFTGYRYYTDDNIIDCKLIKLLKSVDFTLEEIVLYKNNLNTEILEKKQQEIIERMELLRNKYQRISMMKEEINSVQSREGILEKVQNESNKERILRRKYERRNIRKRL